MKKWMSILIIVIIVVGLSTGGVLATRELYFKEENKEVPKAEAGDSVEIHYVGRLSNPDIYDSQRIFDTSYEDIPGVKSPQYTLTYQERERGDPFQFTVGEGVIEGWNENIKGMAEGESKRFSVPPEKGYGSSSEELIYQIPKTETVPVYEEMGIQEFSEKHNKPSVNMMVEDQFWGWEKTVISIGSDIVKLRHDPQLGESYHSYSEKGFMSEVTSIDSNANEGKGEIEVEHTVQMPTVVQSDHLSEHDDKFSTIPNKKSELGQNEGGQGIVIPGEDHITLDFNDEVVGQTLYFEVELVNLEKA